MSEINAQSRSEMRTRVIGNTTYIVTSVFSENARETLDEKLVRFIAERVSGEIKNTDLLRPADRL